MERIGQRLVGEVGWGVKARVSVGTATSMVDLWTDLFVCYTFLKDKRMEYYFEMTLGTILLSMALQLTIVGMQNKKRGMKRMTLEALPVLMGLKTAIDAYRVAAGVKEEVGETFDLETEMIFTKAIELFAEAIPGVIIQLLAIMTANHDNTAAAWSSLGASALSAGFISATVSYDFDTDPKKRQETPTYYGYIPASAKKRTLVFVLLLLISANLLVFRCSALVLLELSGEKHGRWLSSSLTLEFILRSR